MKQGLQHALRLLSFDPLRSSGIPSIQSLKPADWFRAKDAVKAADWILFPEYWQVNPLVYGWKKRIFPSINTYHLGHNKIEMSRAFEAVCHEHVPFTQILPNTERSLEQILDEFSFPFVAKTVKSARGTGVFLISNRRELKEYVREHEVLYIQEYLPIQKDLRVVYIGDQVLTAYWRIAAEGRFHNNVSQGGAISFEHIPDNALSLVDRVAKELGVNHAGFDVAEIDGHFFFLEFNVRFGGRALCDQGIKPGEQILRYLLAETQAPHEPSTPELLKAG